MLILRLTELGQEQSRRRAKEREEYEKMLYNFIVARSVI